MPLPLLVNGLKRKLYDSRMQNNQKLKLKDYGFWYVNLYLSVMLIDNRVPYISKRIFYQVFLKFLLKEITKNFLWFKL